MAPTAPSPSPAARLAFPILAAGALLAAACGGPASSTSSSDSGGTGPVVIVASAIPSGAPATGGAQGGSASTGAGSGAAAGAARNGGGGGSAAGSSGGQAATRVGALPGTYPVHQSARSSLGNPYDGDGTLTVSPPAADRTQSSSTSRSNGGGGGSLVLGYLPSGEVTLVSIQSAKDSSGPASSCPPFNATFSPAVELVPAQLAGGVSWSGPIAAGGFTGSYSGSVTGQGSDAVGGTQVPVWKLHGAISLTGKYCSYDLTAKLTLDTDWAPSLQLTAAGTTLFDATVNGTVHVTGTSTTTLLSARPVQS